MKIIHIESGLGNQMLSFAEYLVIKKLNPEDSCFIETIIYDIPECNKTICQWNGYELERIFGIKVLNIKEIFNEEQWNIIINDVKKSQFWINGWRYAPAIVNAINKHGYNLKNYVGEDAKYTIQNNEKGINKILNSRLGYDLKRWIRPLYKNMYRKKFDCNKKIFIKTKEDVFAGQSLGLRNYGANIDFVKDEIQKYFKFPKIIDKKNLYILEKMHNTNSVAIHARRGDMLQSNGYCYKYGYFKRAVKYIRKYVKKPVFFIFCDTGSVEWCKDNPQIFGINIDKDDVYFVDWNVGLEYYRDIQLMSECKHNIITNSSFGWWGAYFNKNSEKITISPNVWINTKVHL